MSSKNLFLFTGLTIVLLLFSGCCGPVSTATNKSSLELSAYKKDFDPNKEITVPLKNIILTRSDLSLSWQEKDSWGDYKYEPKVNFIENVDGNSCASFSSNGEHCSECAEFDLRGGSLKLTPVNQDKAVTFLFVKIHKMNSVMDAKNDFIDMSNKVKQIKVNEKVDNIVTVGNEMLSVKQDLSSYSGSRWSYNILFRRNNVLVDATIGMQGYSIDKSKKLELEKELRLYSTIIDGRIMGFED